MINLTIILALYLITGIIIAISYALCFESNISKEKFTTIIIAYPIVSLIILGKAIHKGFKEVIRD